jgi:hypothetical protein
MGLDVLKSRAVDLPGMKKSSSKKCAPARLIRNRTSVQTAWIKERFRMGSATNIPELLKRVDAASRGDPGHDELARK